MNAKELNEAISFLKKLERGKDVDWGKLSDGALEIIAEMATSEYSREEAKKEQGCRVVKALARGTL